MSAFRELAKKFRDGLKCKGISNSIPPKEDESKEDKPNEINPDIMLSGEYESNDMNPNIILSEKEEIEILKKKGIPVRLCGCHYQALYLGKWRPSYEAYDLASGFPVPDELKVDEEADKEKYMSMVL